MNSQRLEIALARLLRQLPMRGDPVADSYLMLEVDGKANRVKAADVLWIKAQQNYSAVRITGKATSMIVPQSMAEWEGILPPEIFERLDRSVMVNVMQIRTVSWLSRDETLVDFYGDPEPVRVGRTAAQRLKMRLSAGR